MNLEVGKYYINRRGEVIGPIRENTGYPHVFDRYPFESDDCLYTEEGMYYPGEQHPEDLIKDFETEKLTGITFLPNVVLGDVNIPKETFAEHILFEHELLVGPKTQAVHTMNNQSAKKDAGKPPMELLSAIALEGTAQVLAFGAKKYSANGWRTSDLHWTRILGAIFRHGFAILRGEDIDPESGLPHVDHLGCEIMFLQELYRTRKDLDDRYVSPKQAETK